MYVHIVFLTVLLTLSTRTGVVAQSDSTVLAFNAFLKTVVDFHPVVRQAGLQMGFAEAEMQSARGNFDPVVSADWDEKYFDDKHYFRLFQSAFRIPTWFGLAVSGGFENTDGIFLNPENTTDINGLWSLGIEANLIQGLVIDERRAALQQAEVFRDMAENERIRILNQLIVDASTAYIRWQARYANQLIIQESITLAEEYFEATRQSFINGDKPAIDTLEAYLIVQDRNMLLQDNALKFVKARQVLENFLWFDNLPLELQNTTIPEAISDSTFNPVIPVPITELVLTHPDILAKEFKRASLEIDLRLKREKLKPQLKVKYQPLLATTAESIAPAYAISNYKWGFGFSMPIPLRSERAAVRMNRLKIQEIQFEIQNKRNMLQNKIEASLEQQNLYNQQLELQRQNIRNYFALLEGEQEKFSYGESSVFLLNSRQEKYVMARIKYTDLVAKYQSEVLNYMMLTNTILDLLKRVGWSPDE